MKSLTNEDDLKMSSEAGEYLTRLAEKLIHEDRERRDYLLNYYMFAENYWQGRQNIYYSSRYGGWVTMGSQFSGASIGVDESRFEKAYNIFEAHGQSIVAAISSGLPKVVFFPDDASKGQDEITATTWSKIAELIQRQNDAKILFSRAAQISFLHGLVFGYNYSDKSDTYGTESIYVEKEKTNSYMVDSCPVCGGDLGEYQIEEGEKLSHNEETTCPHCGEEVSPNSQITKRSEMAGEWEDTPKTREIIKILNPIEVNCPTHYKSFDQIPYLVYSEDLHVAQVSSEYGIDVNELESDIPIQSETEFRARQILPIMGTNEFKDRTKLATITKVWLRSWTYSYEQNADVDVLKEIKSLFPDGAMLCFANNNLMYAENGNMNDHWTILETPYQSHLHAPPIGLSLFAVQNAFNQQINTQEDIYRHAIPINFADPDAINFSKFRKTPPIAGLTYPAKRPSPEMALGNFFHETRPASIPRGLESFTTLLEKLGEVLSGDQASISGAVQKGGSMTFGEYRQSNEQALQRLFVSNTALKTFWKRLVAKSTKSYAEHVYQNNLEFSYSSGQSETFEKVWVSYTLLLGEVGDIHPDASEGFPLSMAQKRELIYSLVKAQSPIIIGALEHPENATLLQEITGMNEFFVPGADPRRKQLMEIQLMIRNSEQEAEETATLLQQDGTTVPVGKSDFHEYEMEAIRNWLSTPTGVDLQRYNPVAYQDIQNHLKQHAAYIVMQAQGNQQQQKQQQGQETNNNVR